MKVWIFGDSFAASRSKYSWTALLSSKYDVVVYASNGSSQYRIWKAYKQVKDEIDPEDCVLFCHTSPYRVFLKNNSTILSRLLPSHPYCDIIINDIIEKKESKFIKILRSIWDEEYFVDTHDLLLRDMDSPHCLHFTFFESETLKSFHKVWQENKGGINHMSAKGNRIMFEKVAQWLG